MLTVEVVSGDTQVDPALALKMLTAPEQKFEQKLSEQMVAALAKEEFQWALELSDHLKWLNDGDRELARKVEIKALRGLGAREYNVPNRNYYLSYANELESGQLSEVWF